jgi:death-on-curing protein
MTVSQRITFRWIDKEVVIAIHDQQIAEHGGAGGIRDMGLIESALARPHHLIAYDTPDIYDLAASYGYGIARNHGFIDGNKRTAYVVTRLFLCLNGHDLKAPAAERVIIFEQVGKGESTVDNFAAWLRKNGCRRRSSKKKD